MVSRARPVARVTITCSRARKGPVSPVPTARLPIMAATTTSHGWRVARKRRADTTMRTDCATRARRGPKRAAGDQPQLCQIDGEQHSEKAIAEGARSLREEDETRVTSHARASRAVPLGSTVVFRHAQN